MKNKTIIVIAFVLTIVIAFVVAISARAATPPITTPQGGTGWGNIVSGTLLTGNGTNLRLSTTSPLYPLQIAGGLLQLAFGTTTANTWSATQTFSSAPVLTGFSGLVGANTGTLYSFASSSLFGYTPLNPTRSLTVAGTAKQITSSAGAQDLSADRTWTLSLPSFVQFPGDFNATNGSTTNATTSALDITSRLTFGGVSGTAWSAFCTAITGGAGLCDGTDNTGSGGAGTVSTSSSETNTYVPYWTTNSATPALLSGGESTFTYDATANKLTVSNASTTLATTNTLYGGGTGSLTLLPTGDGQDVLAFPSDAKTAGTLGGDIDFEAGAGSTTGNGGTFYVYAGNASQDSTGNASGGHFDFRGGQGGGAGGNGGYISLSAGDAVAGSGNGGDLFIHPGTAASGGTDGHVFFYANNAASFGAKFDLSAIAGSDKTFTFPNQSGTLCLTTTCTGTGSGLATSSPVSGGQVLTYSQAGAGSAYGTATSTISFSGPFRGYSALGTLVGGSNSVVTYTGLATTTQPASSNLLVSDGGAGVFGVATGTVSAGSSAITVTAGRSVIGGALSIDCAAAGSGQNGCLSSSDWTTFNGKLGSYDAWTHPAAGKSATTSELQTTGGLLVNAASSTFTGGSGLATTTFHQGIQITATGNVSPSISTGGLVNITNTNNAGTAFEVFTNKGSGATGRAIVFNENNSAYDQDFILASSSAANTTAFNIKGLPTGKGILKIEHTGGGTGYTNGSAISIDTSTNDAQGIFIKIGTGIALNIQDSGSNTLFKVDNIGSTTLRQLTSSVLTTNASGVIVGTTSVGVPYGGTGQTTFSSGQLLYGNGTNALSSVATTSVSCSGTVSCTAFTAIGSGAITITGSGGGTGNVSTSTNETAGRLAYWTTTSGTPAKLGDIATTTVSFSGPFTGYSSLGTLVGGSNSTITWSGLATTSQPASSNLLTSNGAAGVYGTATSTLTASSPLTGSFTQVGSGGSLGCTTASASAAGCLSIADWTTFRNKVGTTSSSETAGQVAIWGTTSGTPANLYSVATSSESITGPFNIPSTYGKLIGGSGSIGYWGLSTTSQPSSSNILVSNGTSGVYGVATSSATCSGFLTCSAFTVVGSASPTITTTGQLSTASGGTNHGNYTAGSVVFAGSGGTSLAENNSNFFWDNSLNALGIGTTTMKLGELTLASTSPQLFLSAGAGQNQWFLANEAGSLYFGTSTLSATSTFSAITVAPSSLSSLFVGASSTLQAANPFPATTVAGFFNEPKGNGTNASTTMVIGDTSTTTSFSQIQMNNDAGTTVCLFVHSTTLVVQSGKCN